MKEGDKAIIITLRLSSGEIYTAVAKRSRLGPTGQTIGAVNFTREIGEREELWPAVRERVSHAAARTIQDDISFSKPSSSGSPTGTPLAPSTWPSAPKDVHDKMKSGGVDTGLLARLSCFTIIVKTHLILINIKLDEHP